MKKLKKVADCFIVFLFTLSCLHTPVFAAIIAAPTASSVFVNNELVAFNAYTIGENNYFKLRDIAMVLRGTPKQIEVEYLAVDNSIALYSGQSYTPAGDEMAPPSGSANVNASKTTSKVYLDGAAIDLTAYTINGYNYFKLRDIGAAIDFGVIWDGPSNMIRIDTSLRYEEVNPTAEPSDTSIVSDHSCTNLSQIPTKWINKAITDLHILYGHTSHGSQITKGLLGLTEFKGSPYIYKNGAPAGSLDLRDNPFKSTIDLGQPDNKSWASETRNYLQNNKDVNVVMWSWCGQLSYADEKYVNTYLDLMQELEAEFPEITFVYMTGHLDGSGENGTLARNNKQIRDFCISNNKALYDFADIESFNPDGAYFGDKYSNDACDYDSNGDKQADKNWALEWQNTHIEGVDWYACSSAHSHPVNANMKAYAAWWLMARLAGWNGNVSTGT